MCFLFNIFSTYSPKMIVRTEGMSHRAFCQGVERYLVTIQRFVLLVFAGDEVLLRDFIRVVYFRWHHLGSVPEELENLGAKCLIVGEVRGLSRFGSSFDQLS